MSFQSINQISIWTFDDDSAVESLDINWKHHRFYDWSFKKRNLEKNDVYLSREILNCYLTHKILKSDLSVENKVELYSANFDHHDRSNCHLLNLKRASKIFEFDKKNYYSIHENIEFHEEKERIKNKIKKIKKLKFSTKFTYILKTRCIHQSNNALKSNFENLMKVYRVIERVLKFKKNRKSKNLENSNSKFFEDEKMKNIESNHNAKIKIEKKSVIQNSKKRKQFVFSYLISKRRNFVKIINVNSKHDLNFLIITNMYTLIKTFIFKIHKNFDVEKKEERFAIKNFQQKWIHYFELFNEIIVNVKFQTSEALKFIQKKFISDISFVYFEEARLKKACIAIEHVFFIFKDIMNVMKIMNLIEEQEKFKKTWKRKMKIFEIMTKRTDLKFKVDVKKKIK